MPTEPYKTWFKCTSSLKMAVYYDVDEQIQRHDLGGWQFVLGNILVGTDDDWESLIWNKTSPQAPDFCHVTDAFLQTLTNIVPTWSVLCAAMRKPHFHSEESTSLKTHPWAVCPNTDGRKDFHRPVISVGPLQCAHNLAYRGLSSLYSIISCEGCGCSVNVKAAHP